MILKTTRLGYDGKGQRPVENPKQAEKAWIELGQQACIIEEKASFVCEISVVLARDQNGKTCCFPIAENEHRGGILHRSSVPADIDKNTEEKARAVARRIAVGLNYCGVLCVELFVMKNGQLLVNEIAPRTHNSGHYTLDACRTSQFDQQVKVLSGAPLGDTKLTQAVTMINLLGSVWQDDETSWYKRFPASTTRLHWYGKKEARAGRKMGHFCVLGKAVGETVAMAEDIYRQLNQDDQHH